MKVLVSIGQQYGHLLVLSEGSNAIGRRVWNCRCLRCGKMTQATTGGLRSGDRKSCGCLHTTREVYRAHLAEIHDGVGYIPLTKGWWALVDAVDFDRVNAFNWHCAVGTRYAASHGPGRLTYLHAFIVGRSHKEIDHRDHDGLNNQRHNLRLVTRTQQMQNTRPHVDGTSHFKGVSYDRARSLWAAEIMVNKVKIHLGRFDDEVTAACAYNVAAKQHFGEFAYINRMD